ncbi:polysaccharide deacetylase family protein [Streptomyces sp. p1417]|uniref:Polysaccharide deacetylase family protein n=1 Tax=Streptomyces typhae TaxID=2681492 RepID=A0A6L6WVR6_9ACTN|nr:polysaccharide deacetylase family protein [Streptomyces typhae]MVO85304.1 polysaccharide deacetylase family protein [Streptomyces typhae]
MHPRRRAVLTGLLTGLLTAGIAPCLPGRGAAAAPRRAAGPRPVPAAAASPVPSAAAGPRATPAASPGATAAAGPRATPAPGPRPPAALLGKAIRRLPTDRRVVALTFNAAWNESGLDAVLAELRRRRIAATFFPTGAFAKAHPASVRAMGAAHGLGNHSHSHPYFDSLSTRERRREVRRADTAIRTASGTEPLPFFRFPYSATTPDAIADVNALGYAAIEFTADTNGYLGPARGMTVDRVVARARDALAPGAIIQMHVGSASGGVVLDARALPRIVDEIGRAGYRVVDLRDFLTPATP